MFEKLPVVTINGQEFFQSSATLRYIGSQLGDGSLYPKDNASACLKIDEMLGLADDLQRAWTPALYVGMRPAWLGHEFSSDDDKAAMMKKMREKFLKDDLPVYMGFIVAALKETGAFIAGSNPTIADCQLLPQLAYFTKGIADFVPKDCLEPYPEIIAYINRMNAVPAIKEWYGL